MHVSVEALLYEHSFYTALFPGDKQLKWLLRQQLHNRGTAFLVDGRVKFSMEGTRSSGDLNTSLGNCLLMCSMIWAYAQSKHVCVELANNGDDCVVFMERSDLEQFSCGLDLWFRERGFAMTVEEAVDEFEEIEFCQTHPVQLSTGWRMVRNVDACLRKDPMCLVPIANDKALRKWCDAVGDCGQCLTAGVPVLSSFYGVFKKHGLPSGKFKETVFKNRSQLQLAAGVKQAVIDSSARVSFYYAFGILPGEQIELEAYYERMSILPYNGKEIAREFLTLNPRNNILHERA